MNKDEKWIYDIFKLWENPTPEMELGRFARIQKERGIDYPNHDEERAMRLLDEELARTHWNRIAWPNTYWAKYRLKMKNVKAAAKNLKSAEPPTFAYCKECDTIYNPAQNETCSC